VSSCNIRSIFLPMGSPHPGAQEGGLIRKMRRRLIHLGAMLVLTLCIWGHVSEIFDHWDNTFKTGTDIEYSTVLVVLVAGAVLVLSPIAAAALRLAYSPLSLVTLAHVSGPSLTNLDLFVGDSPPQPLRI
jgi:hypothetical protein